MATTQIHRYLQETLPHIDDDLRAYVLGYFEDSSNDYTSEGLTDFLGPIFDEAGIQVEQVEDLVCRLSGMMLGTNTEEDVGARKLDAPMIMQETEALSKLHALASSQVGDIRHTMGRNAQKTTVDQKKLLIAEERLMKKREKRGDWLDADGIPIYDPNVKPDIIVNQAKSTGADSKSKDIKIENFDISYAGNKILTNADLALNYGRRYGMVGKNGIGKSTLLRAIAHKELYVPPHIKILHVEQEVSFYS
jgi:ATP-binding cassette subfamily F protein 3